MVVTAVGSSNAGLSWVAEAAGGRAPGGRRRSALSPQHRRRAKIDHDSDDAMRHDESFVGQGLDQLDKT